MDKENPWGKDGTRKDVDLHLYRSMIGSLMYLTASRPDIMFAPKECHLHAIKRIFIYLKGHPKLGLWYPKDSPFDLTIVATSTTEAEYVAAASCYGQVLWIQNQLLDYGLSMSCETLPKEISTSILRLLHTAKTLDLVWIWLGGDYGNVFLNGFYWDSVANMCKNYLHWGVTSSIPTVIPIPTVTQPEPTPLRHYTRRVRIAQSSTLPPVADEPTSPVRDVSEGEACPTDSGFIADQDRATIDKSSTLPHDIAPQVTSPTAVEGSMQLTINELTALYTSLQRQHSKLLVQFKAQEVEINKLKERVKILEDNQGVIGARSANDAPIKGRKIVEERGITGRVSSDREEIKIDEGEVAVERTSEDTKEMATVLTSMDAATVLAGGIDVPTGTTIVTPYLRRKGKEVMVESDTLKKQRWLEMQKWQGFLLRKSFKDNYSKIYKFQSQQKRPWTKKQKSDCDQKQLRGKVKDFKGMTFEEIEAKIAAVWKLVEDFIPMGSKEEAEWLKRKGFNLEQEKAKKQKTSEEVSDKEKSFKEIPEKKVKEMMQFIPIEEVYVQALQVKHLIIDWKHLDREDLNQLWVLVKEYLSIRPALSDKEMELWVELKRLYEPDPEDQLWALQYTVTHPIFSAHHDLLGSQKELNTTLTKVTEQMTQLTSMCELACQFVQKNLEEKQLEEEPAAKAQNWKLLVCYDYDDDEEGYNSLNDNIISELPSYSAITPTEPIDSLSMGDEYLNTILATKSDEFIKSCVENLVPNPKSMPNHDSSIIISSKIDSLFDEFAGELTLLKSIPLGIDETNYHPEKEIRFSKRLLYDNLSPRPSEEIVSDNSNADIESFSPSPIPNLDSDPLMEEIDLSFNPDDPMPPGMEEDDDDSERDIPILEKLLENYSLSLPANESYHFDIPLPYYPTAKPPYGITGTLNIKMMGDVSDQKVPIPNLTITRILNQEKSLDLLSH
nr:hypothetical protein [Tanacetum cinerariifolium]GEW04681.1 hypothetical protein [Tanacetum cinerariifolium]